MIKHNHPPDAETPVSIELRMSARHILCLVTVCLCVATLLVATKVGFHVNFLALILIVWCSMLCFIWQALKHHNHTFYGLANTITTIRAAGTALFTGFIPVSDRLGPAALWIISGGVALLIVLDGLDGYFARRNNLTSEFGARFDMEVDAFLSLSIAVLLWRLEEAGPWVLGLGLMRYLFVVCSWWLAPLRAPLFPSMRRKTVCVIQLSALCLMLSPLLSGLGSSIIGSLALVCLSGSFITDIIWLYHQPTNSKTAT